MKSRISIEVDFDNNNQPVIQILQTDSDDVRDRLLKNFCEQVGGSSWCKLRYTTTSEDMPGGTHRIFISPIREEQFQEQAKIMLEQDKLNKEFKKKQSS